jgi:hypothetical protein
MYYTIIVILHDNCLCHHVITTCRHCVTLCSLVHKGLSIYRDIQVLVIVLDHDHRIIDQYHYPYWTRVTIIMVLTIITDCVNVRSGPGPCPDPKP